MSKRTRKLAEQAKCYADENSAHYLQNPHWIETFEEKFAELIVKECADVLIEHGDKQFNIRTVEPESHTKTTDWMEGYEEAVKHYGSFLLKKNAKLIKKHFGVEE